ncbi:hypothetical protein B0H14DRAFT_2588613 [Mycena olivaceomarginata]|nr:hypothetical protein B0H14DRAFT_2588613 [Mycena olivaceomarginata]
MLPSRSSINRTAQLLQRADIKESIFGVRICLRSPSSHFSPSILSFHEPKLKLRFIDQGDVVAPRLRTACLIYFMTRPNYGDVPFPNFRASFAAEPFDAELPPTCELGTSYGHALARYGRLQPSVRPDRKNRIRTEHRCLACKMVYFSFRANADLPPRLGLVSADLNVALICAWAIHHYFHAAPSASRINCPAWSLKPVILICDILKFFVTLCARPGRSFFVLKPTPRLRLGADLIRAEGVLWRTPTAFLPPMKIVYEASILELRRTDLHANQCLCIFLSALTAFLVQVVDSMRMRQIKTFDFGHSACDSCGVVDGIII